MRYWHSYGFVFGSHKWGTNLLFACLCSIIPGVGPILMMGYCFEVIDALLRRRAAAPSPDVPAEDPDDLIRDALPAGPADAEPYPDFNFNRFADYLTRGIWPFLVQMIVYMAVGAVAGFFWMVGMVVVGVTVGRSDVAPLTFFGVFLLGYLVLFTSAGILMQPLYIRAGLSADFVSAFSTTFYRDFFRRVGKELILVQLFLAATGTVLIVVGLTLCYVGMFPAIALLQLAHHHLDYQLYELYLQRGGEPVLRKQKLPAVVEDYRPERPASEHITRPQEDERPGDAIRPEGGW